MERPAAWLVSSFSLASKTRLPAVEVSATPWLLEGVVTQLCTSAVMSMRMNCWDEVGVKVATADPRLGAVA
jgi:hypothetical protein